MPFAARTLSSPTGGVPTSILHSFSRMAAADVNVQFSEVLIALNYAFYSVVKISPCRLLRPLCRPCRCIGRTCRRKGCADGGVGLLSQKIGLPLTRLSSLIGYRFGKYAKSSQLLAKIRRRSYVVIFAISAQSVCLFSS